MSVELLIDELEERGLLPDRVMAKLRERLSQTERPMSAKAVAKFLVEKKHLTQRQATEVLGDLLHRGVDVDAAVVMGESENALDLEHDAADDDPESSSIFAPYLTQAPKKQNKPPSPPEPQRGRPVQTTEHAKAPAARAEKLPVKSGRTETAELPRQLPEISETSEPRLRDRKESRTPSDEWDSPLILIGGGALVVLVLIGATLAWMLNWESGDEKLRLAQEAIASGSYTQGIAHYQEFLENFPRHRDRSLARVQFAMARLRKTVEAANYGAALDIAREELDAIEDEEKFAEAAQGELASLLPRIAMGLATEADTAADVDTAEQLVEKASTVLALAGNTKYVPITLRDESELEEVRQTLERVGRRQQSRQDLQQLLAAMDQAIAAGDTRAAFTRHMELLKQHPELADDKALVDMVQKAAAAEQTAIRFVAEEQAAETSDRPTPWVAALAVAHRRGAPASAQQGSAVCVRVEGAAYGLDSATGRVLWRRQVGYAASAPPVQIGNDVLIFDSARQELISLSAASGELRWRQIIGEPFAPPLVMGERGFIAADSGRLFVIDLKSGARTGYVKFAQKLRVTPAANLHQQRLYLTGDHSVLYSISLADWSCTGVYHTGHGEGSIRVPPVLVLDKLAVLENDGVETSRLRLLALDAQGTVAAELADRRLTGSPTAVPLVAGRRMFLVTDRGQMEVYDIGSSDAKQTLTLIASRAATGKQPIARHAAVVGNHIWMGDTQLTKFAISPTGNRLPVESIENDFSGAVFDHPFVPVGNSLIHVHRPKGRSGFVVAATDAAQGRVVWETQLAMPPAGAAVVDASAKALAVANAEGFVFRFDEAAIRSRVQDQPLAAQFRPSNPPAMTTAVNLGQGRAAFCAPGSDQILLYDPTKGTQSPRWVNLASPLACAVTPMGNGFIAPLSVGQVFDLSATDGTSIATPFQPRVQPGTAMQFAPAGVIDAAQRRFVISDGREKIYLVAVANQPSPHMEAVAEGSAGPYPIQSRMIVLGDVAIGIGGESHIARFQLPSLEPAGVSNLPAPVVWGPFPAGDAVLLATADGQLVLISPSGEEIWRAPLEHGNLAGEPLVDKDSILIAFRNGVIERRAKSDGKPLGSVNVEHSLAAGPVDFSQRLVVTATDGTLLVVDRP